MGLLDALFQGSQGGGLLDFLRSNSQNQQFGSGLQSDQAQYSSPMNATAQAPAPIFQNNQPSPLDNAQWPAGPASAPSQANAQMIPQQPPPVMQAPSPQGPGMGDRLGASLQSFANSGGPLQALVNGTTSLFTGQRTDPGGIAQQQANLTIQALKARGVPPSDIALAQSNPEAMSALFKQMFKEAPTGFEKNPEAPGLRPTAGGPADPAYLRLKAAKEKDPNEVHVLGKDGELYKVDAKGNPTIVHKNQSSVDASLDDDTTRLMANQYLVGDKAVLQNLGRGAQGSANLVKLRQAIRIEAEAQGLNAKDIVNNFNEQAGALAGQRSIGTRAANISLAANEANNMVPIALRASEAVPRTDYMPINQAIQAMQKGQSSPQLARFVAATNSLVNAYVRAVSPSGVPTDSMREHAYSMLNSAQSHEAYKAVTSIMQDEMKAALQAPAQVRKELRTGNSEAPTESQGKSGDAIYAAAKDAIAKGAPREKVIERMRQNGVDPSGL